jgi:hypothetical protein
MNLQDANEIQIVEERTRELAEAKESLHQSERHLAEQLHRVGSLLVGAGDIEPLCEQMLDAAIAIMQSNFASIQNMSADGRSLRMLAW